MLRTIIDDAICAGVFWTVWAVLSYLEKRMKGKP
jgi:hypothetical protein